MADRGDNAILTVEGLRTYFPVRRGVFSRVHGYVRAVDGVDLTVRRGTNAGPGGRERLGQDHRRAGRCCG